MFLPSSLKENWWNFFRFLKLGYLSSKFFARSKILVAHSIKSSSDILSIPWSSFIYHNIRITWQRNVGLLFPRVGIIPSATQLSWKPHKWLLLPILNYSVPIRAGSRIGSFWQGRCILWPNIWSIYYWVCCWSWGGIRNSSLTRSW